MPDDSSEDDYNPLIEEAIDTTLFSNNLYNNKVQAASKTKKSERHLENGEKRADLRVSSSMQELIGHKVSKIINNQIEFVENAHSIEIPKLEGGIKLFADSEDFVDHEHVEINYIQKPRKKIKKRIVDGDFVNKRDQIKMVALSPEYIISKKELKHWKSKKKQKIFDYKSVNGNLILQNAINKFEFK